MHEAELWIAGLADAYKYQQERRASKLLLKSLGPNSAELHLSCAANHELYDQPLTIELSGFGEGPGARVRVIDHESRAVAVHPSRAPGRVAVRFSAMPRNATYTVERLP